MESLIEKNIQTNRYTQNFKMLQNDQFQLMLLLIVANKMHYDGHMGTNMYNVTNKNDNNNNNSFFLSFNCQLSTYKLMLTTTISNQQTKKHQMMILK